jgi:hypothetical protein
LTWKDGLGARRRKLKEAEAKKRESTRMDSEDQELMEEMLTLQTDARRMETKKRTSKRRKLEK